MMKSVFSSFLLFFHIVVIFFVSFSFRSLYEEPSCDEGFKEIVKVNFLPTFKEERIKELYMQFLHEGLPAEYFLEAEN